jgi:hypothetical protein
LTTVKVYRGAVGRFRHRVEYKWIPNAKRSLYEARMWWTIERPVLQERMVRASARVWARVLTGLALVRVALARGLELARVHGKRSAIRAKIIGLDLAHRAHQRWLLWRPILEKRLQAYVQIARARYLAWRAPKQRALRAATRPIVRASTQS